SHTSNVKAKRREPMYGRHRCLVRLVPTRTSEAILYWRLSRTGGAMMGKFTAAYGVLIVASLAIAPACKRSLDGADMKDALTEQSEDGSVSWDIDRDGKIRALVRAPNGEVVKSNASAALTIKGDDGTQTVVLKQDPDTGLLVGRASKLKGELTEVDYA